MKLKTVYLCQHCKEHTTKWSGQCPHCKEWNCLYEDVINIGKSDKKLSSTPRKIPSLTPLNKTQEEKKSQKISSGINEFDRVIGGGFVTGSLTLLSGEPGIGKSTITLKIADNLSKNNRVCLISGEESISQIADRSNRLGLSGNTEALNSLNLEEILEILQSHKPDFAIIDSIQVISSEQLDSAAGSISQVRFCTEKLMELAKSQDCSIILIGHVNKNGNLAGPRVLEHLVDTVMHLEGDRYHQLRLLRTVKNRFGSCNEVGIFEMTQQGLTEVKNPSAQFIEQRKAGAVGSALTVTLEGTRPLIIEVQALVSTSHFGYPKRTANGFDLNRLQILIAVLEKHANLNLQNQDVFINVVGGIKLSEPAADLAVLTAITSSLIKKPLPENSIVWGEVGLSGELRRVNQEEQRAKQAKNLGFEKIISPEKNREIQKVLQIFKY